MWSNSTAIYQLVDRTHLDSEMSQGATEKKTAESNCRWRTETQQPWREVGCIDVHFPFLVLQNKSAKQAFSVSPGIFKGLPSKRSLTKCNETKIFPQDKENCPLFPYNLDEVNEKKQIPLWNLPNYESTAKVQFWQESSVVKTLTKASDGIFFFPFGSSLWFFFNLFLFFTSLREYHPKFSLGCKFV